MKDIRELISELNSMGWHLLSDRERRRKFAEIDRFVAWRLMRSWGKCTLTSQRGSVAARAIAVVPVRSASHG